MVIGNVAQDLVGLGRMGGGDAAGAARGTFQPENLRVGLMRDSLREVEDLIVNADRSLHGDMFVLRDRDVRDALAEIHELGITQHFLLDPEFRDPAAFPAGTELVEYGRVPYKNYSKMWSVDGGERAMLTTGAYVTRTRQRIEGVATFDGAAARAVHDYLERSIRASAAPEGSPERSASLAAVRAAAEEMGRYGVVANDQMAGVRSLTEGVEAIVRNEQRGGQLTISTKIYNDPGFRQLVDDAVARGVEVRFSPVRDQGMHATVVAGSDGYYLGTGHLSPRGLGNMHHATRKARDSGIIVSGAEQTAQLRVSMDSFGMMAMKPEEFDTARRLQDDLDAYDKLKDRVAKRPDAVPRAEVVAARTRYTRASWDLRTYKDEIAARRAADGVTFANPHGNAAAL